MRAIIITLVLSSILFDLFFPEIVAKYELFFEGLELFLIAIMIIKLLRDFARIKDIKEFLRKKWLELAVLILIIILLKLRVPLRRLGEDTEKLVYSGSRAIKIVSEELEEEF